MLILCPNKEILEQNYGKLKMYGIFDIGIYSASMGSKTIDKFTYATIGSIYKKPELFKDFKHIIIDECHFVNMKKSGTMYHKFFKAISENFRNKEKNENLNSYLNESLKFQKNSQLKIMGLTATPFRTDLSYRIDGTIS